MKQPMRTGLWEATRLVRAGQLLEATALIQRTLAASPATATVPARPASPTPIALPWSYQAPGTESSETPVSESPQQDYGKPVTRRRAPHPGQFISGSHTNPTGTLSYKLYIPDGFHGQALPLVVMLHGCTQTPDDFAAGTRMNQLAEEHPCLVVYPAQAVTANQSRCWHWFQTANQRRDQGEPSLIAGITRHIMSTYPIDSRRIYVAGLSAGGAMAAVMGITYPDLYAAIGIHSGVAYGLAHDLPSAFTAMQQGGTAAAPRQDNDVDRRVVPIIVFHGDGDTTVHPGNGDQVIAQWAMIHADVEPPTAASMKLRSSVQRGQITAGHAYRRTLYHDAGGQALMEQWLIQDAAHAWSGGSPEGSFTDPRGPDASREMLRFFAEHPQTKTYS